MCAAGNLRRTATSNGCSPSVGDHDWCRSVPEQALEARRCQLRVSDCVLDRLVAQIALDGSRIDAVIRQLVATARPQHVRVNLHVKARRAGRAAGEQIPAGDW